MQLVYMNNLKNKELYTTSEIIAECAEINRVSVRKLIDAHKNDLQEFGFLSFEMTKIDGRGRPRKVYFLNEQQATLLITYLDNTPKVRQFKKSLVRAFFELRQEVEHYKIARAIERPKRRELTDAIKEWQYCNKWSYKQITDLILKRVTGLNAKQLKAHRHAKNNAIDVLSVAELEEYTKLENACIGLIDLGKSYKQIATAL